MDLLSALTNKGIGFIEVNKSTQQIKKTLIVIGVARGGTSLIAGSLDHMGIFTGDSSGNPVYEDLRLAKAFEEGEYARAQEIINDYNSRFDVWAFKRPASVQYLTKLISMTRNPVLLIVFRDIFSIANRNKLSMKMGLVPGLQKALHDYNDIVEIIGKRYCDMYFFSYDKVMIHKELFIKELSELSSATCTSDTYAKVSEFIQPDSASYLKNTRINKAIGRIDNCTRRVVSGWAAITNNKHVVELELHVNGHFVSAMQADLLRADVERAGLHPTGECGFKFLLDDNQLLNNGDTVQIYVINNNFKEELQTTQFHQKQ